MTGRDKGSEFGGLPILGALAEAAALADVVFVNGIASERTHRRKLGIIAGTGLDATRFVTLIHPLAAVSRRAAVGHGSCIGPGCAVSGQVEIGAHAWLGSHVGDRPRLRAGCRRHRGAFRDAGRRRDARRAGLCRVRQQCCAPASPWARAR